MIGLTSNNNIALLNEIGMSDVAANEALDNSKFPIQGIVEYVDINGTQFLKAAVLECPDIVRISNDPPPNLDVVAPIEPPKPAPPKQPDAPRQIASTLPLPGEVTAAVTGSKGRYLVLTIPSKKLLVVVDVREMQIRKTIPVKSADVQVASSASRFVVLDGKSGPLDCYDFETLEIERSKAIGGKPFLIAMSEFGEGPLWVVDEATPEDTAPKIRLFDLDTLSPVNVELASPGELLQDIRDGSSNRSASVSRDGDAICIPS